MRTFKTQDALQTEQGLEGLPRMAAAAARLRAAEGTYELTSLDFAALVRAPSSKQTPPPPPALPAATCAAPR